MLFLSFVLLTRGMFSPLGLLYFSWSSFDQLDGQTKSARKFHSASRLRHTVHLIQDDFVSFAWVESDLYQITANLPKPGDDNVAMKSAKREFSGLLLLSRGIKSLFVRRTARWSKRETKSNNELYNWKIVGISMWR